MTRHRIGIALVALLALAPAAAVRLLSISAEAGGEAIGGARPQYGPARVGAAPNAAAIGMRLWMPGLDEGYTPQGLAVIDDDLFVAGYRSTEFRGNRGPCRVFRIAPATGTETGHFDVPAPCGHAGGLAASGDGRLFVADTHTLFVVDLARVFAEPGEAMRRIPLGPGVTGGLAASGRGEIWLGTYREDGPGRLYRFATAVIDALPEGAALTVDSAAAERAIPAHAQGAALDAMGGLWVSSSDLRWGALDRFEPGRGQPEAHFAAPPMLEGIAFDQAGRLWAVSEAGARHDYDHPVINWFQTFYPLVFAIDTARLQ